MIPQMCPAVADALGWLPWALPLAGLFDAAVIIGGALIVRKWPKRSGTQ